MSENYRQSVIDLREFKISSNSIPANTPHSFEVIETGQVVDFFSPPREDYLQRK